jgi:hypothetical protein
LPATSRHKLYKVINYASIASIPTPTRAIDLAVIQVADQLYTKNYAGVVHRLLKEDAEQTEATATVDGLTTGIIPESVVDVLVISSVNTKIATLPVPVVKAKLRLSCTANGYELKADDPGTVYINNVVGAAKTLAVAAGDVLYAEVIDITHWVIYKIDPVGAVATAGIPD